MAVAAVVRSEFDTPWGRIGRLDAFVALALGSWAVVLTTGLADPKNRGHGVAAPLLVLAMVLPVAFRRHRTLAVAGVVAAGAVVNAVAVPHVVRCGAALPVVFLVAFAVGARVTGRGAAVGFVLCAVDVAAQALSDPQLGAGVIVPFTVITGAFFGTGRLVRSRAAAAEELRARSLELRAQREETARMAVMADRAELSEGLESALQSRIDRLADTADRARSADRPEVVREALATIEAEGREALHGMREIVGTLKERPASEPQPSLAQVGDLLTRATSADARLTVEGNARSLPSGIELSGYRIVEHLVSVLEDAPEASVKVRLAFSEQALEIHVSGPPARKSAIRAAVSAARERAALHGGVVDTAEAPGMLHLTARIPLVSATA